MNIGIENLVWYIFEGVKRKYMIVCKSEFRTHILSCNSIYIFLKLIGENKENNKQIKAGKRHGSVYQLRT